MKRKLSHLFFYMPIITGYFIIPLIHDVFKYSAMYKSSDWLSLVIIYVVGIMISLPVLYLAFKMETRVSERRAGWYLRMLLCYVSSGALLVLSWGSGSALYSCLPLIIVLTFLIMTIGRKEIKSPTTILRDVNTSALYEIRNGMPYLLSPEKNRAFLSAPGKFEVVDVSNFNTSDKSYVTSGLLESQTSYSGDLGGTTYINPSSGLPMNGGMSGVDVAGNSWGTNFNDPSHNTSYDPNRGY